MTDLDIKKGVKLSLGNAKSLLKDAKLLLEHKSTGHALFLIVSAIEEASKAFIYAGARVGVWKQGETEKDVFTHPPKLTLFISHLTVTAMEDAFKRRRQMIFHPRKPVKPLDIDDFVEMAQDVECAVKELWKGRIEGLYVDRKNGKWTTPSDFEKSEVETLLSRAERYIRDTEFRTRNIVEAKKEVALGFRNWLVEEYIPFAINYFLENIDDLYNDKVISRKLYEHLKKLRVSRSPR